jgi:hypothetical protein
MLSRTESTAVSPSSWLPREGASETEASGGAGATRAGGSDSGSGPATSKTSSSSTAAATGVRPPEIELEAPTIGADGAAGGASASSSELGLLEVEISAEPVSRRILFLRSRTYSSRVIRLRGDGTSPAGAAGGTPSAGGTTTLTGGSSKSPSAGDVDASSRSS